LQQNQSITPRSWRGDIAAHPGGCSAAWSGARVDRWPAGLPGGQWPKAKHGIKSRRKWRKLHLAVNAASGMIVARTLTDQDADDLSPVGPGNVQKWGQAASGNCRTVSGVGSNDNDDPIGLGAWPVRKLYSNAVAWCLLTYPTERKRAA
jgi:hypothetical protein